MLYKRTVYANAIIILTFSTIWLHLLLQILAITYLLFQRMSLTQRKKLQAPKKHFTLVPKNLKLWHYASWIYTAGYILQVLIMQKSYIWVSWNVFLKYNYGHLVTNCWFCCKNFSTFNAFPRSLGKSIYWNLNFEIYFQFVSTRFLLKTSKNKTSI